MTDDNTTPEEETPVEGAEEKTDAPVADDDTGVSTDDTGDNADAGDGEEKKDDEEATE